MDLVPYMYWERQEPGSQLCAQHCLNNLLQQFTYSEFDLADIARRLDKAENAELSSSNQNKKSYNYDDSGYFSISVLERALEVWDLNLVRWRGEAMRAYQEHPEEQVAFILNLSSHWIPLRRFGSSYAGSVASKRWYNLNSFLQTPEWISPTYLRMVLSQAEQEGYSVFCVRKSRPAESEEQGWGDGGVAVLPECQADMFAVQLGEPAGRGGGSIHPAGRSTNPIAGSARVPLASTNPDQPTVDPSSITPPNEGADPLDQPMSTEPESSNSRSRRRRQADPSAALAGDEDAADTPPASGHSARRERTGPGPTPVWTVDDDDEEINSDDEVEGRLPLGGSEDGPPGPMDFARHNRDYDDEDAALQAALKASMEDIPTDWVAPALQPKVQPPSRKTSGTTGVPATTAGAGVAPAMTGQTVSAVAQSQGGVQQKDLVGSVKSGGSKFKEEVEEDEEESPAEELSPDEIRRRRLAKFGG